MCVCVCVGGGGVLNQAVATGQDVKATHKLHHNYSWKEGAGHALAETRAIGANQGPYEVVFKIPATSNR